MQRVAWRQVKPGTPVAGATGGLLGLALRSRRDRQSDIAVGFEILLPDGREAYLPSSHIQRVTPRCIESSLTLHELAPLGLLAVPPWPRRALNRVRWFRLY